MESRMHRHLYNSKNDHSELYKKTYWIEYAELESDYLMNIYEIHYICKYKPKFNTQFASDNINMFDLPKVNWKPYIFKGYIEDFNTYNAVKYGIDISSEEATNIIDNDENFHNQFIKHYRKIKYIHNQFNEYDDYLYY